MIAKRLFFATLLLTAILAANVMAQYYDNGVTINAQMTVGAQTFMDGGNFAGVHSTATDGYDSGTDVPEPAPPASDYISLYFPHSEWGLPFFDNFMKDVRNGNDDLTNAIKTYSFEVITNPTGETVDLTLTIETGYSATLGIVLYDVGSSAYQNIRDDNTYNFTASGTQSFDLSLGDATQIGRAHV